MISGARYHRVATYSVKNPVASCSPINADLARPKSQICPRSRLVISVSMKRRVRRGSGKDLEVAIRVEEEVRRFQIAMQDAVSESDGSVGQRRGRHDCESQVDGSRRGV